jgi:electron transfer flavoprotein beta subunit
LDRDATDAVLDEINERAVEEALQLKERTGDAVVTVLTMGPDRATDAIRKALSMGADQAVHVSDEALAGSDAVATARVLAKALGTLDAVDLVLSGNEASDGRGAAVPAMVAELLGWPALTHVRELSIDGGAVEGRRETDDGVTVLTAELPVVVSVSETINEPAVPVVQRDHGREEEADRVAVAVGHRRQRRRGRARTRVDDGDVGGAEAAQVGGGEGHR